MENQNVYGFQKHFNRKKSSLPKLNEWRGTTEVAKLEKSMAELAVHIPESKKFNTFKVIAEVYAPPPEKKTKK